jgi:hypothetical protein
MHNLFHRFCIVILCNMACLTTHYRIFLWCLVLPHGTMFGRCFCTLNFQNYFVDITFLDKVSVVGHWGSIRKSGRIMATFLPPLPLNCLSNIAEQLGLHVSVS